MKLEEQEINLQMSNIIWEINHKSNGPNHLTILHAVWVMYREQHFAKGEVCK